ncbi:hypothetical protein [Sporolactobacillus terrae]|uniref:hypothetical protein n=1 Tax=Sporolactobacillus terrae TaxID=269673 RepID=UPI001CC005E9|nr:hypothetical protein [Sporolactobacillus terrae]UAK18104.1 hypothetical protein K7399_15970 [Sporolactobacillus terrae]
MDGFKEHYKRWIVRIYRVGTEWGNKSINHSIKNNLEKEKVKFYKRFRVEARPEDIAQMKKDIVRCEVMKLFVVVGTIVFVIVFAL